MKNLYLSYVCVYMWIWICVKKIISSPTKICIISYEDHIMSYEDANLIIKYEIFPITR